MRIIFLLFFILLQGFLEISCYNLADRDCVNMGFRKILPLPTREERCEGKDCGFFADYFRAIINQSTSPCDDFYQHACGGWISNINLGQGAIVDRYSRIQGEILIAMNRVLTGPPRSTDTADLVKAQAFYSTCLDEDKIEETGTKPLSEIYELNGGWPLIRKPGDVRKPLKWVQLHEIYSIDKSIDALFRIGVGVDQTNPRIRIITISTPDTSTHDLGFSSDLRKRRDFGAFGDFGDSYRTYIIEVAIYLYGSEIMNETTRVKFLHNVDKMIDFHKKLSKLADDTSGHDSADDDYRIMTIEGLQKEWDKATLKDDTGDQYEINWFTTIENLFGTVSWFLSITKEERVALISERYIKGLAILLVNTDEETIVNYIHWNTIHRLLKYTNKEMRRIRDEYTFAQLGIPGTDDRSMICAEDFPLKDAIIQHMKPFIDSKIADYDVRKMIYAIREEFRKEILCSTWLTKGEKVAAVKKMKNIVYSIGYPDWVREPKKRDRYGQFYADSHVSYFFNAGQAILFLRWKELRKLRSYINKTRVEWDELSPFDTTATYIEQANSIVIPAGMLNHPYIRFEYLPAARWAALGAIIGHEIGHSFDNEGRLWDPYRHKLKWWSDKTIRNYKTKEKCFIEKYNSYKIQPKMGATFHVNGTNTLRENIADHQGILMAFKAYQESMKRNKIKHVIEGLTTDYTEEKLYFYSLAQSFCEKTSDKYLRNVYGEDVHPPWKVRINGALSDMKEFSAAFQCKSGDRMKQSSQKCQIWGH